MQMLDSRGGGSAAYDNGGGAERPAKAPRPKAPATAERSEALDEDDIPF